MFKCKKCFEREVYLKSIETSTQLAYNSLRAENEYLKKLVDRLLMKQGTAPVKTEDFEKKWKREQKKFEDDPEMKKLKENGAVFYGGI